MIGLPLAIIPTYLRTVHDLEVVTTCLRTLRDTTDCDIFVVDDGSPARDLLIDLENSCRIYDADWRWKPTNEGFSQAVNVGLEHCLRRGQDALLVNADIEFGVRGWLDAMLEQTASDGQSLAPVVGALLLYPGAEMIQHAGIFFSNLDRQFHHRFHFGPANLPEAQIPTVCPVTGALQLIRHECLAQVGIYDPTFRLGWEDVDFCLRAMLQGFECVYCPAAVAVHHESLFRGRPDPKIARWTDESWRRFVGKYADVNLAALVPTPLPAQ